MYHVGLLNTKLHVLFSLSGVHFTLSCVFVGILDVDVEFYLSLSSLILLISAVIL